MTMGVTVTTDAPSTGDRSGASDAQLIAAFRRAALRVPAYARLLAEQRVPVAGVTDAASFRALVPVLSKANTFDRFAVEELSVDGMLPPLSAVLTSSGHGGRFSFGVITRAEQERAARFADLAFDAAFHVKTRRTLAVNCLPMGVGFSSNCMTVATTSVREDMVVAVVDRFGARYEQILLVGDPLFMKRLTDYAHEVGLDWTRYRVSAVIGEETFGEHYRGYLARRLGLSVHRPERGYIMSSFGVGELGLHLCFETPDSIALRRALFENPGFAADLLGSGTAMRSVLPIVFAYDPQRTLIEVTDADADGFGCMTTSLLDLDVPIPLLRYQTGDIARLLDRDQVFDCAARHRIELPAHLPAALLALRGRTREALPNGSHVSIYKDALYADHEVASSLTGALRVVLDGSGCTVHVQCGVSGADRAELQARIMDAIPRPSRPDRVVVWPRERFPFGMQLDYERKFTHFVPGESNPTPV